MKVLKFSVPFLALMESHHICFEPFKTYKPLSEN